MQRQTAEGKLHTDLSNPDVENDLNSILIKVAKDLGHTILNASGTDIKESMGYYGTQKMRSLTIALHLWNLVCIIYMSVMLSMRFSTVAMLAFLSAFAKSHLQISFQSLHWPLAVDITRLHTIRFGETLLVSLFSLCVTMVIFIGLGTTECVHHPSRLRLVEETVATYSKTVEITEEGNKYITPCFHDKSALVNILGIILDGVGTALFFLTRFNNKMAAENTRETKKALVVNSALYYSALLWLNKNEAIGASIVADVSGSAVNNIKTRPTTMSGPMLSQQQQQYQLNTKSRPKLTEVKMEN